MVIFDALNPYRLKGPSPHMQGHERAFNTLLGNRRKQRLVEMQPCGRRGNGTGPRGIHRLVALAVGFVIRPVYIRRQRHMADPLKQRQHLFGKAQLEQGIVAREHFGLAAAIEQNLRAGLG